MSSVSRSAKVSSFLGLVAFVVIVLLFSFSPSPGNSASGAAQDEKPVAKSPPVKAKGNADKQNEPEHALQRFMRQKLQASNLILEGLCTENLKMVSEGSDTLMKMSREEHWRVSNDMMYRRYSEQFVSAVEELKHEADDLDMNGASTAWVDVTMKCLRCHEWVRNTVVADADK
jgi:hypothetical protein